MGARARQGRRARSRRRSGRCDLRFARRLVARREAAHHQPRPPRREASGWMHTTVRVNVDGSDRKELTIPARRQRPGLVCRRPMAPDRLEPGRQDRLAALRHAARRDRTATDHRGGKSVLCPVLARRPPRAVYRQCPRRPIRHLGRRCRRQERPAGLPRRSQR